MIRLFLSQSVDQNHSLTSRVVPTNGHAIKTNTNVHDLVSHWMGRKPAAEPSLLPANVRGIGSQWHDQTDCRNDQECYCRIKAFRKLDCASLSIGARTFRRAINKYVQLNQASKQVLLEWTALPPSIQIEKGILRLHS